MEDGRGGKQEEQEKQDEQDEQGAKGGDLVRHRQVGPSEAVERDRLRDLDGSATEDEILRGTQLDAVHRIGGQRGEGAEEAIAPAASRGGPESAQLRSREGSGSAQLGSRGDATRRRIARVAAWRRIGSEGWGSEGWGCGAASRVELREGELGLDVVSIVECHAGVKDGVDGHVFRLVVKRDPRLAEVQRDRELGGGGRRGRGD